MQEGMAAFPFGKMIFPVLPALLLAGMVSVPTGIIPFPTGIVPMPEGKIRFPTPTAPDQQELLSFRLELSPFLRE
jgi:hypothetical protein